MNSVKLINVDGSAAFELKKKVKSAKLRLEFAAIENDIEEKIKKEIESYDGKVKDSPDKAFDSMKYTDTIKIMNMATQSPETMSTAIGSIVIDSIANKFKDEKILRLAQCTLDGSKLNEANAELFNSSWDSDFWQSQDLDILEEFVNSFR